jgi:acyl-coenzyme A synthetase/AMP-(fatty) acid ligase
MYRTGDLGAYNDRGELMFLGRRDSQIKKQGYRIELGEIECALCAHPEVETGCCFYDAQTERIFAVYTGAAEEKLLLRAMKDKLPKYMLPDVMVRRDMLPLTGNGKIDRVQLRNEVVG